MGAVSSPELPIRRNTALLAAALAEALEGDGEYVLKRLRRRSVRGYRALTPHLLRRVEPDEDDT